MKRNKKERFLELISITKLGRIISSTAYYYHTRILSENIFVKRMFKAKMGYDLDLINPKTLNEKIQWLKLNDRTKLHTICADKILVRDYVKNIIGEEYLTHLLFTTTNPSEIKQDDLPNVPFIVKANHDSGSYIIINDKNEVDLYSLKKKCEKWIKNNYYYASKEWQYKNIKPQILFEKLHIEKSGSNIIQDYKIHCFMAKPKMISIDIGRGTKNHKRNWYDTNWKPELFKWTSELNGQITNPDYFINIDKPLNFKKMIEFSKLLSKPFKYVRVDWYEVNGKLFFGEITFHHDSGYRPIEPKEYDYILGDLIEL
jgi:hypothetical protein